MAEFTKAFDQGKLTVREERRFTDPHIRFVRIRGRVVPIINKNRVGRTVNRTGNAFITAGAVLGSVGGAEKILKFIKKRRVKKILSNPRTASIFNAVRANATMFKQSRHTGLALSKIGKRSIIAGLAVGITGIGLKAIGFDIQSRSPFGADL